MTKDELLLEQAEKAMQEAADGVVEEARRTGGCVVVWENGAVRRISGNQLPPVKTGRIRELRIQELRELSPTQLLNLLDLMPDLTIEELSIIREVLTEKSSSGDAEAGAAMAQMDLLCTREGASE